MHLFRYSNKKYKLFEKKKKLFEQYNQFITIYPRDDEITIPPISNHDFREHFIS